MKMILLKLTQWGNPILRQKAKKVQIKDIHKASFQKLTNQMFFTLKKSKGVGLAAPQINKSLKLAVIEIKESNKRSGGAALKVVLINPEIVSCSQKKVNDWEGCLSFPEVRGLVPRAKTITVKYYDEAGKLQKRKLQGFQARVFQHEIDHLNGLLYIDRMKDMKLLMTLGEFKKRILKK